ncbi:YggS family pyridoxal phosphate-dependent enzyme [Methylobacterium nonmethylotrophicum]|uniref:Pyridoxal phosphate homeostasis protein n=1 Tax=Methylobacterium nonmethylotrophicum TaxID=1141884 RepID=A0A4Z0NM65_9HYPH|nr:YggS family pyridoxal phosphate-dependent enzyme [Methylobacterium nonmethylotrophicum]TGD97093.1 YggS family pyridoxal phosphate-dependent enzyme [Methylobacterium nonmethylotrophicum]
MIDPQAVTSNLDEVRAAIARAAHDSERDPAGIALIAVSKTIAPEGIRPALEAGQRLFGENYVQEAKAKWPALREAFPDTELHLIGPLQSNKAREAVELFDVIHTLDRRSLAAALAKEIARAGRHPTLLVQVNTGEEPQKGGVAPGAVDAFLAECRDTHGLTVSGLMCIPPAEDPPSAHFGLLAAIARRHALPILSMGMSADYPAAIQMGATHVRVGSAIFGARQPKG